MTKDVMFSAGLVAITIFACVNSISASGFPYPPTNTTYRRNVDPDSPELMRLRVNPSYPLSAKLARQFGYKATVYNVTTEDGYILSMTRIRQKNGYGNGTKAYSVLPAVLLLHELEGSSAVWVGLGPGKAYALKLVEAGFDVWLGDFRGVPASQRHTRLNPGSAEFWSFTLNEHGRYDITAFVEKVRRTTHQPKILVSTYCMSSASMLIYCHYHPDECKTKIRGAVFMGSFLDLKSLKQSTFKTILETLSKPKDPLFDRFDRLGYALFSPEKLQGLPQDFVEQLVEYNRRPPLLSTLVLHEIEFGRTRPEVISRLWPEYSLPWPLMTYRYFVDTWKSGIFRGLDRGKQENLKRYGSEEPPVYDLKRTTMPVFLIYSDADTIAPPEENNKIASGIANLQKQLVLRKIGLTHFEMIFSDRAAPLIYSPAITWFKELVRNDPQFARRVLVEKTVTRTFSAPSLSKSLAESFGYAAKTYRIVTSDGYVLTMTRIGPRGVIFSQNDVSRRPPVLVLHGLATASAIWLGLGPRKAYALKLVDAGFDVWLGDLRGAPASQKHVVLDPDNSVYWRFTPHEHALDVGAFVDTIRKFTKREKVLFSGYSMSTKVLFIYCHVDPLGCRQKIGAAFLLAPVLSLPSLTNGVLKHALDLLEAGTPPLIELLDELGYVQFPPDCEIGLPADLVRLVEIAKSRPRTPGALAAFGVPPDTRQEVLNRVFPEFAIRSALDTYRFVLHTRKTGIFQGLNWGTHGNIERYRQTPPPVYNLALTTMPVYIIYSDGDDTSTPREAEMIASAMPNLVRFAGVHNTTHTGFFLSDSATRIYDIVIRWMRNFVQGNIPYRDFNTGAYRNVTRIYGRQLEHEFAKLNSRQLQPQRPQHSYRRPPF